MEASPSPRQKGAANAVSSCKGDVPIADADNSASHHVGGQDLAPPLDKVMDEFRSEISDSWSVVHDALRELHHTQDRIMARIEAQHAERHLQILQRQPSKERKAVAESNEKDASDLPHVTKWKSGRSTKTTEEVAQQLTHLERDKSSFQKDIEDLLKEFDEPISPEDEVSERGLLGVARRLRRRIERLALRRTRWFLTLKEPPRESLLARFISSGAWQCLVDLMIVANGIFMVYSSDYMAAHVDTNPDLPPAAAAADLGFVVFFLFELTLKVLVHRAYFLFGEDMRWNLFDSFLVLFSVYDTALRWLMQGDSNANLLFLRSVRILKLARTLRVVRVLRLAGPLRLMLQSVIGSVVSLFWAFVMLFFVFYMFGIAMVQVVTSSLLADGDQMAESLKDEVLLHFGSVSDAMLVCYMATSGGNDWATYYDVLSATTPAGAAMFLLFIGFTQLALWNIITGIFVDNAMKLAMPDRNERALDQRRADLQDTEEFRRCVQELDIDCSGTITKDEFKTLTMDPRTHSMFSVIGLNVKDAELFFELINRTSGATELDFDFLIDACMKMRGPASSLDVHAIMHGLQLLNDKVDSLKSADRDGAARKLTQGRKDIVWDL